MATRGKSSALPRYLQRLQHKTHEVSRSSPWSEASLRVTATEIQSVTQATSHVVPQGSYALLVHQVEDQNAIVFRAYRHCPSPTGSETQAEADASCATANRST